MKIGMILDNEFTGDLRVENEISALQNAGHEVSLICFNFGGKKNYEEFHGAKIFRVPISKVLKDKLKGLNNTPFNFYPLFWAKRIKEFIKKNKIEVIHVHDLWMLEGALKANKNFNLPIVADLHENFVQALEHYKYANVFPGKFIISKKRWARKEIEWLNKVDKIITVIEEAVERYVKLGIPKEKIFVVPNYVNLQSFEISEFDKNILEKHSGFFTLAYTGGFDAHRGLETVIKAAPLLKEKIKNLKIVLVGRGSNFDSLKNLSAKLKVEDVVIFEGWQPAEKLPSFIKAAKIGVIPHLKTIHTDNTIPHKLFQYMILEKPVIASDCNPLKRILHETKAGMIFKSGDEKDFADKVLQLYENPALQTEMGTNGKKAVKEKYNWDKAAENLIKVYKNLAK